MPLLVVVVAGDMPWRLRSGRQRLVSFVTHLSEDDTTNMRGVTEIEEGQFSTLKWNVKVRVRKTHLYIFLVSVDNTSLTGRLGILPFPSASADSTLRRMLLQIHLDEN